MRRVALLTRAATAALAAALLAGCGQSAPDAAPQPAATPGAALVAHATGARLAVFRSPHGGTPGWQLANPTRYRSPLVLRIVAQRPGWDKVLLPVRPNGTTGWVRRSDVKVTKDPYTVRVDTAARRMTVLRSGTPVVQAPVAVGAPKTPTPTGTFFITALLAPPDPHGAYGPYAYGLSGHSPTLTSFGGGDGTIGIHGTDQPGSIGHAVTHGCIRLRNTDVRRLVPLLPLGTPVLVS